MHDTCARHEVIRKAAGQHLAALVVVDDLFTENLTDALNDAAVDLTFDDLMVDDAELNRRASAVPPPPQKPARGYARLYAQEILGADEGCDFAFLRPAAAAQ